MRIAFATLRSSEVVSFGVMYLASVLKQAGHALRLVQAQSGRELVSSLRAEPCDLVAFSVTTGLHRTYLDWGRQVKEALGLPTLFGGPHPTFFPEMLNEPEVDAIVQGEGEESTPELLEALEAADGRIVPGASYCLDGRIVAGPLRAPPQDLDALPLPDRDLFFSQSPHHAAFPVRSFLASRGCPYRCTYCFNRTLVDDYRGLGKLVRVRSPERVVAEILEVKRRWPTQLIWFLDANFAVNHRWVDELCQRLAREVALPFYCKVRPNVVDERLARTLARGGCVGVGMGIESGDDHLREHVLERKVSREQIVRACHLLGEQGIKVMSFNMVGLPGETYEMARSTVDLNIEAGVAYAMTMVFQPYPRTRLTDYAVEHGFFDGNFDRLSDDYYSSSALRAPSPGDERRLQNLQRLFALAVEFPAVRRRLDWLVELSAPRLYARLFELWHRHCFHRRFYRLSGSSRQRVASLLAAIDTSA